MRTIGLKEHQYKTENITSFCPRRMMFSIHHAESALSGCTWVTERRGQKGWGCRKCPGNWARQKGSSIPLLLKYSTWKYFHIYKILFYSVINIFPCDESCKKIDNVGPEQIRNAKEKEIHRPHYVPIYINKNNNLLVDQLELH